MITDIQQTSIDWLIAQLNQTITCNSITISDNQIIINCTDREQATAVKNDFYPQITALAKTANCGLTSVAFVWVDLFQHRWILPV